MSFNKNILNHELEAVKDFGYAFIYLCKKCDYYIIYYRSSHDYYLSSNRNWQLRTTPWTILNLNLNCEELIIKDILE